MKRLLIYDLDGTLVDTSRDLTAAVNHALTRLGQAALPEQVVRGCVGRGLAELLKDAVGTEDPARLHAVRELFEDYYGRHLMDTSQLYPGTREMLERFRARTQGMITNKPDPFTAQLLDGLGIAPYFSTVIPGNSIYPKKPDPASVRAMMTHAKAAPTETVLIGDSTVDLETGRRAGVETVVLAHGFETRERLLQAAPQAVFEDLPAVLRHADQAQW